MAFFNNLFNKQIKWEEDLNYPAKKPYKKNYIKFNKRILVQSNQMALIFYKGKLYDIFKEGEYILNVPCLPKLTIKCKLDKPSLSRVTKTFIYPKGFYGNIIFINFNPIIHKSCKTRKFIINDKKFNKIKLSVNLMVGYQITNELKFANILSRFAEKLNFKNFDSQMNEIVARLARNELNKSNNIILNLLLKDEEFEDKLLEYLNSKAYDLGFTLNDLKIESVQFKKNEKNKIELEYLGKISNDLENDILIDVDNSYYKMLKNDENNTTYVIPSLKDLKNYDEDLDNKINDLSNKNNLTNVDKNYENDSKINKDINENTNGIYCSNCGEFMPSSAVYCYKCGKKIIK